MSELEFFIGFLDLFFFLLSFNKICDFFGFFLWFFCGCCLFGDIDLFVVLNKLFGEGMFIGVLDVGFLFLFLFFIVFGFLV